MDKESVEIVNGKIQLFCDDYLYKYYAKNVNYADKDALHLHELYGGNIKRSTKKKR